MARATWALLALLALSAAAGTSAWSVKKSEPAPAAAAPAAVASSSGDTKNHADLTSVNTYWCATRERVWARARGVRALGEARTALRAPHEEPLVDGALSRLLYRAGAASFPASRGRAGAPARRAARCHTRGAAARPRRPPPTACLRSSRR
jgi:hypothetical protein